MHATPPLGLPSTLAEEPWSSPFHPGTKREEKIAKGENEALAEVAGRLSREDARIADQTTTIAKQSEAVAAQFDLLKRSMEQAGDGAEATF